MTVKKVTAKDKAKAGKALVKLAKMQERGDTDVKKILMEHSFGLGPLDEDNFNAAMDRIAGALAAAWSAGFAAGLED